METTYKKDLKINGEGNTSGGEFSDIVINGAGKISGDVNCENFKCNGESKVLGSMSANTAKVNGSATITGNLKTNEMKILGHAKIKGNVESKETKINGQVEIDGSLSSDEIRIAGDARVNFDCSAESFDASGGFKIGGFLNADDVNIKLYGPCSVKEIGCSKITVKKGNAFNLRSFIKSIFPSFDSFGGLSVDVIEGDDINIENTKARIVRGNNVTVGAGCEIELIEYKSTIQKTDSAKVKEERKI
jgi:cytoskeletal protein CcmA (bactofilin family)